MTDINIIENKISAIEKYLSILNGYKSISREKIENDPNLLGALERYLFLAIQAAIDTAEAIISYKEYRKPSSYAESFKILVEQGLIDAELEGQLAKTTGFRNILTHGYQEVNYDILFDVLQNRLVDLETFVKAVKKMV